MPATYIISDPHFGHSGVCKFLRDDGITKLRPWNTAEEMDEALIENWNSAVKSKDKIYVLGDVVINRRSLKTLSRLNGDKVLIKGNHDIFKLEEYTAFFRDIRSYHVMNGMILSHIPIHVDSIARFGCNIHGHLHHRRITMIDNSGKISIDPKYFNVSVECIDYKPILFEALCEKIKEQGGTVGFSQNRSVIM